MLIIQHYLFIWCSWWSNWTNYIDEQLEITEQHGYTKQEIENLRNDGYIQEALTP